MSEIAQLPYQGHRSKQMADKSWQTIIDHPELSPAQVASLVATSTEVGWVAIKANTPVTESDFPEQEAPLANKGKPSVSRPIRAKLHVLWELSNAKQTYPDFEDYYRDYGKKEEQRLLNLIREYEQ